MVVSVRFWRSQPPALLPESEGELPAGSTEDRGYVVVESHAAVAELAGVVVDQGRVELVVVLTSRAGEPWPALDVHDVRVIVGPRALIYVLATGALSLELSHRVPNHRGPYNGGLRVWLPGVSLGSDPREHPSVFDPTGEYGPTALRQLAYGLREAFFRRGIEPHVNPLVAYRSLELVRVQEEAGLRIRALEHQLAQAEEERDEAALRARAESEEAVRRARTERDEAIQRARDGQLPRRR